MNIEVKNKMKDSLVNLIVGYLIAKKNIFETAEENIVEDITKIFSNFRSYENLDFDFGTNELYIKFNDSEITPELDAIFKYNIHVELFEDCIYIDTFLEEEAVEIEYEIDCMDVYHEYWDMQQDLKDRNF